MNSNLSQPENDVRLSETENIIIIENELNCEEIENEDEIVDVIENTIVNEGGSDVSNYETAGNSSSEDETKI